MKKNEFAVLQELPTTQLLVVASYEEDNLVNPLKLKVTFYNKNTKMYGEVNLRWNKEKKKNFEKTFKEFKNKDTAIEYLKILYTIPEKIPLNGVVIRLGEEIFIITR